MSRGKPNATTTTTINPNKSSANNKKNTETSIRENSIEESKDKIKQISKKEEKHNQSPHQQNICLINNSLSGQPISVNISIRNHVVGVAPASTTNANSKKITSFKVIKPAVATGISSKPSLGEMKTARQIGPVPESVQVSPKRKDEPKRSIPFIQVSKQDLNSTIKSNSQKQNISLTHLQQLLKNKTSPRENTQKPPDTARSKKQETHPKKAFVNTTTISVKKNHTIQATATVNLNVSRNHPKKMPKETETQSLFPLTAAQALKLFAADLSDFEKGELLDYETVFYMGNGVAKVNAINNGSYDDDKGDYNTYVGEQVGYRYEIIDILGKGSFGQAIKCLDHKHQRLVALKIIRSKKRFYHQATVEVKILKYIKEHDEDDKSNCVKMFDYFVFRKHICITFELLSINLYDYIKENNFVGLSIEQIKKYAIQILSSLKMLKEHNIIHCDLKPENILLKEQRSSIIKLIDFGSSCFENEKIYTYIQSRFYRAPEIMLGISYTTAIDMWSLGCILAELYTGFPIFPGESEPEQMALIMEVNGVPPLDLLKKATRREVFFNPDGSPLPLPNHTESPRRPSSKTLGQILKCSDSPFVDFLQQCFIWEPEKRLTPAQALNHKWISKCPSSALTRAGNASGSTLGSIELNLTQGPTTQIQTYYATQRKNSEDHKKPAQKKEKPGLNKTLAHENIKISHNIPIKEETINKKSNDKINLQDKLDKLKEKLKAVTTSKVVNQVTNYNTNPMKKPDNNKGKSNANMMLHILPKKTLANQPNVAKPKQQLKQSNIF